MKKKIIKLFTGVFLTTYLAAGLVITPATAAYEAPVRAYGTSFDDTAGVVYSLYYYGSNGGIQYLSDNVTLFPLPYGMMDKGMIFQFCIYHGRIYYVTGEAGSDYLPASIYSCNMQGGDNKLIADNAINYGNMTIVDNMLYYDAFSSEMEPYFKGYSGGIYKINLNNYSWQKVVSDRNCTMDYCDGDYIYYTVNNKTYAIDVNGQVCFPARSDTDEFKYNSFIKGNKTYYMNENHTTLYSKDKNGGNVKVLSTYADSTYIDSISNDKIYTVTVKYLNGRYYAYVNSVNI